MVLKAFLMRLMMRKINPRIMAIDEPLPKPIKHVQQPHECTL